MTITNNISKYYTALYYSVVLCCGVVPEDDKVHSGLVCIVVLLQWRLHHWCELIQWRHFLIQLDLLEKIKEEKKEEKKEEEEEEEEEVKNTEWHRESTLSDH